jgi:hypothetical protein
MKIQLVEGFDEEMTPDMKYYAFDWDDNLLYMPTKIILKDDKGNEVGMGTEEFAEYRSKIGKENFEYKDKTIVGFSENPFRFFSTEGDKKFMVDALLAKTGPAWSDFVECVNGGSVFSIITARGHSPETIAKTVKKLIEGSINGISKQQLVKNLKKYNELANRFLEKNENVSDEQLVDFYVFKLNKYYPVTHGSGSAQNPEESKVEAMKEFQEYVKRISRIINVEPMFKDDVSNRFVPKIGFSDDDLKNLKTMKKELEKDPENIVQIYSTHGGVKKKYSE